MTQVLAAVALLTLTGAPKIDPQLVGSWQFNGAPFVTLKADGSGVMEDGTLKWSADGKTLTIIDDEGSTDRAAYQVQGSALSLNLGGVPMALTRVGPAAPAAKAQKPSKLAAKAARAAAQGTQGDDADAEAMAQAREWVARNQGQGQVAQAPTAQMAPAGAPQGPGGGNDQLARLLTSSAWCYFSYSQTSGTTRTERFVYAPNGTWSSNSQREMVNSGPNGSVYAGGQGGSGGRWQTRNNALFMSEGDGPLQPLQFSLTQNSNGYPIITAGGREYSQCN